MLLENQSPSSPNKAGLLTPVPKEGARRLAGNGVLSLMDSWQEAQRTGPRSSFCACAVPPHCSPAAWSQLRAAGGCPDPGAASRARVARWLALHEGCAPQVRASLEGCLVRCVPTPGGGRKLRASRADGHPPALVPGSALHLPLEEAKRQSSSAANLQVPGRGCGHGCPGQNKVR